MIRHCVFLNLRADHDGGQLAATFYGLANLCARLTGASGFVGGPNRDFESKSQDFDTGFTIDFVDAPALETYAKDPEHQALGAQLVAQCVGGADGIIVFDLEVPDT